MAVNNENRELAIKLTDVKKMYKLGQIGGGTLQADLQSWWAKKRGLEDPNTKIGEQRLIGQTFMALNGIDLEVYKGEALGIIGGNGAGKSTMLKLLSRVTAPTSGKIQIWGRVASMLEVGTGFNGEMTGRENIYMNGAILGMTKAEIDAKMEDIIEFSEVRDFIDTPVKRYSSGMYVKLAFSVAAHLDSEIVIMDEVLAVGDMAFQKKCLDKMRDVAKKEGRTVLYVSHNMNTIRQLCDRCVVLEKGRMVFSGEPEEAITYYLGKQRNSEVLFDFSQYIRPNWGMKWKIKILEAGYVGKVTNEFSDDEVMQMKIRWINLQQVKDIGILVEVCTHDDVGQASFELDRVYSGEKDAEASIMIMMDLNLFQDASYMIRLTFFENNDQGAGTCVDSVTGICFEKKHTHCIGELMWVPRQWGYIKLPTPQYQLY